MYVGEPGVRLAYLLYIFPFSLLHHPLSPSSFSPFFPPSLSSLSLPTLSLSNLLPLSSPLFFSFHHFARYVVRCLWAPSGKYFVTASYDKMACVYR